MQTLPLADVHLSRTNPRREFNVAKLAELTESIRKVGIIEPILVRPLKKGGYEVVVGHRRRIAAQDAGLIEIPAMVREISDTEAREIQMIENLQR